MGGIWIDTEDKDGNVTGTVHLNTGRKTLTHCRFCLRDGRRRLSTKLCDFVTSHPAIVTHKKTCDAPICDKHATSVGADLDHCPDHTRKEKAA